MEPIVIVKLVHPLPSEEDRVFGLTEEQAEAELERVFEMGLSAERTGR